MAETNYVTVRGDTFVATITDATVDFTGAAGTCSLKLAGVQVATLTVAFPDATTVTATLAAADCANLAPTVVYYFDINVVFADGTVGTYGNRSALRVQADYTV